MKSFDKYLGCLVGGAAGDALGYAVEFMTENQIFNKYGKTGITEYDLENGLGRISDDTQMTMFTAVALLNTTAVTENPKPEDFHDFLVKSYKDWYITQTVSEKSKNSKNRNTCLANIDELYSLRAPGNTCLSALSSEKAGSLKYKINSSKGCGGIMRVAPIGLYLNNYKIEDADLVGADAAAITHGHSLGYIPAAGFVHLIKLFANGVTDIEYAVANMLETINGLFKGDKHLDYFNSIINKAVELSKSDLNDLEAIHILGEGWVAEETLAIALYCFMKYPDDFEKALITSVNHNGDSDSTGAVMGNLAGTYLGIDRIPKKFIQNLEFADLLRELAVDLFEDYKPGSEKGFKDKIWTKKYIDYTYLESKKKNSNLIIFPDFEKLQEEIMKLKNELAELIFEKDELIFVVCKNIETRYMLEFGSLEYKLYELYCEYLRLKRKITLIQALKNRQEKINISKIEKQLDVEFEDYQKKLDEKIKSVNNALNHNKGEVLSDEDTKILKKKYRNIVKKLHPDLNPELSDEKKQLFANAVSAYKNGDLKTIEIIDEMVSNDIIQEYTDDALGSLKQEKDRLDNLICFVKGEIEKIKNSYPYTKIDLLNSKSEIEKYKNELNEKIRQYEEAVKSYRLKIERNTGDNDE